jgi:replicative DNA helicase
MIECVENLVKAIHAHNFAIKQMDPSYKLVVFIDNFHDLTSAEASFHDNNSRFEYISSQLNDVCETHRIPIICTAEIRKTNGLRRPITHDVRESIKIAYKAKAIMTVYNEVGDRDQGANIYWEKEGLDRKLPVLEVKFSKNKVSSFKGRLFFNFAPEMSYLQPASPEATRHYSQMIMG